MIGNDAFQEADITGITRPITKHNYLVQDINDLARIIKEAFYIASTGRPGPGPDRRPVDMSEGEDQVFLSGRRSSLRGYKPVYEGHPAQIKKACQAHREREAAGHLCRRRRHHLQRLRRSCGTSRSKTGIPVTTTLLGLGAFPRPTPCALEMLGMHGTCYANHAVHESDLLIAVGARFDDRVTGKIAEFVPNAKVIHIDIDPASVSKNVRRGRAHRRRRASSVLQRDHQERSSRRRSTEWLEHDDDR